MTSAAVPGTPTAFDHRPTVDAYRRVVRRRRLWVAFFLGAPVALVWCGAHLTVPESAVPLFAVTLLTSPLLVVASTLALLHTPRMARVLRSYAWAAYPCQYSPGGRQRVGVIAVMFAPGHEVLLRTTPYRCDVRAKRNSHPDVIWFAGDPHAGGVVSPVGGRYPVRVANSALWARDPQPPPADALAERAGLAKNGRYLRHWF